MEFPESPSLSRGPLARISCWATPCACWTQPPPPSWCPWLTGRQGPAGLVKAWAQGAETRGLLESIGSGFKRLRLGERFGDQSLGFKVDLHEWEVHVSSTRTDCLGPLGRLGSAAYLRALKQALCSTVQVIIGFRTLQTLYAKLHRRSLGEEP